MARLIYNVLCKAHEEIFMSTTKSLGTKSLAFVIIALLIGLVVGYGAGSLLAPTATGPASTVTPGPTALTGEIPVGALQDLTGPGSGQGIQMRVAKEMAVEEINAWLKQTGQKWTIKLLVEDDQYDPAVALDKTQALAAKGVKVIIGPEGTTMVAAVKGYADSNHILLLSSGSTGASMAIPNDYIFRFASTDVYQCLAQARLLVTYDIQYTAFIRINAAVEDEHEGLVTKDWQKINPQGVVGADVTYDAAATDFSAQAHSLNDAITAGISKYGKDHVAVFFIGTTEVAAVLQAAKDYPALMSVVWIANDAVAGATNVVEQSGDIAARVVLAATVFGATQSAKYHDVQTKLQARLGGAFPNPYAFVDYDITWFVATLLMITQSYDPVLLQQTITQVAGNTFGATGWMALNADGDRAYGDFDVWGVLKNSTTGKTEWVRIASWTSAADTVAFVVSPVPRATG